MTSAAIFSMLPEGVHFPYLLAINRCSLVTRNDLVQNGRVELTHLPNRSFDMALTVVEASCDFVGDLSGGSVMVESDKVDGAMALTELHSDKARRLAIMHAATKGVPDPRINGGIDTFAVDAKGEEVDQINNPKQKIHRWQASIPVTRRLV
jgi:hypothetical protein